MYQCIQVSGTDAENFLQGQLTQDINKLTSAAALPAAWCTPKGRVVATMRLLRNDQNIGLLLPAGITATFLQRISIYKLRADVQLELGAAWQGVALHSPADLQLLDRQQLLPDTTIHSRLSRDGLTAICIATNPMAVELFSATGALEQLPLQDSLDDATWRATLIRAGAVRISTANTEKYTPHMLSLDLAGAVSFDKGCYTGQEIVARTEHRGKSRRRLARYESAAAGIEPGDELFDGDSAVGTVVNASGGDVLAVAPVDLHGKELVLRGEPARGITF